MYSNAPKGINWRSKFHKFSRHHIAGEGDLRQAAAAALRMLSLNPVNILDNFFTPVWISPTASTPTPETLSGISTDLRTQHWSSSAYVASLTNRPLTLIATAAYNPPTAEPSPPSSSPECQRPANGSLSAVAQRDLINLAGAYSTTYDGPLRHWAVPRGTERAPRYDIGNVRSKHRREASLVYRAEPKQRKKTPKQKQTGAFGQRRTPSRQLIPQRVLLCHNGRNSFKEFLDPSAHPVDFQNSMMSSFFKRTYLVKKIVKTWLVVFTWSYSRTTNRQAQAKTILIGGGNNNNRWPWEIGKQSQSRRRNQQ